MSRPEANPVATYGDARINAFLGEKALQYLEQTYRGKAFLMASVKADPIFAGLKTEPRYQAMMKQTGS